MVILLIIIVFLFLFQHSSFRTMMFFYDYISSFFEKNLINRMWYKNCNTENKKDGIFRPLIVN